MKRARTSALSRPATDADFKQLSHLIKTLKRPTGSKDYKFSYLSAYGLWDIRQIDSPQIILAQLRELPTDEAGLLLYIQSEFVDSHNERLALLQQSQHPYAHWTLSHLISDPSLNLYHLNAAAEGGLLCAHLARTIFVSNIDDNLHFEYAQIAAAAGIREAYNMLAKCYEKRNDLYNAIYWGSQCPNIRYRVTKTFDQVRARYAKGDASGVYPFVKAVHPNSRLLAKPAMQKLCTAVLGSVSRAKCATLCWMWIHKTTFPRYLPRDVALIIAHHIWEARKTGQFFRLK